ncbi:MAG TPA: outer membrane lipoprotein-sorting protein [Candidatus Binatia bacterium]|nr:outer membrane lipoprotein-sorting protein [Candidatus Binatia bacterium]
MQPTRLRPLALGLALALASTAVARAAAPDAATVATRMQAALEPARSSARDLDIVVSAEQGESTHWRAGQARKIAGGARRVLTVLLAPAGVRGLAFLVEEQPEQTDVARLYLPGVRRVRTIVPALRSEPFLGSDFTYADLGFADRGAHYRLLGSEERDGVRVYRLEEVPRARWYYARVVDQVAADTWLPRRREYYDAANALWKVEELGDVTRVDGVPTPLRIRMEDVQQGSSSEIRTTNVRWDPDLPDALFDPARLPDAVASPVWNAPPAP